MTNNKKPVKLIWLSLHPPISKANSAGWQTFNAYFHYFLNSKKFDIKLIALGEVEDKEKINIELKGIDYFIAYREHSLKAKIRKLSNIESSLNPGNRHAGLISNYFAGMILKQLRKYRDMCFYPDWIILEWTQLVVLAPDIKIIFPQAKLVANEHDVTFIAYKRKRDYYTGKDKRKWNFLYEHEKKIELESLKICDLIMPHNPDNIQLLEMEGIEKNKCQWLVPFFNDMRNNKRNSNGRDILYFGAMDRPENYLSALWFIENVMPGLEQYNIRFVVLGSNPPKELRNKESLKIHITGFVESITSYFENSMCLVAPLVLGAGIKVKIIEALSSGIPVLTNEIGIEGIPAQPGKEYLHCETANEYIETITKMLQGDNQSHIGECGREFIIKRFFLEKSKEDYMNRLIKATEDK